MSLTSELRTNEKLKERLLWFRPPVYTKERFPIKVPAVGEYKNIIGQAFDYALRFMAVKINFKNPNVKIVAPKLIAVEMLEQIKLQAEIENYFIVMTKGDKIPIVYGKRLKTEVFLPRLEESETRAKNSILHYYKTGQMTDDFIRSMWFYANLDLHYRIGKLYDNFDRISDEEVQNIRSLVELVDPSFLRAKKIIHLNPTFGIASRIIGGADADIIIDDKLIDIKTVKTASFRKIYFDQILCYYVLSLIGKKNRGVSVGPINKVGIYFARHGVLKFIEVYHIYPRSNLIELQKWMMEHYYYRYGVRLGYKKRFDEIRKKAKKLKSTSQTAAFLKKLEKDQHLLNFGKIMVARNE